MFIILRYVISLIVISIGICGCADSKKGNFRDRLDIDACAEFILVFPQKHNIYDFSKRLQKLDFIEDEKNLPKPNDYLYSKVKTHICFKIAAANYYKHLLDSADTNKRDIKLLHIIWMFSNLAKYFSEKLNISIDEAVDLFYFNYQFYGYLCTK